MKKKTSDKLHFAFSNLAQEAEYVNSLLKTLNRWKRGISKAQDETWSKMTPEQRKVWELDGWK